MELLGNGNSSQFGRLKYTGFMSGFFCFHRSSGHENECIFQGEPSGDNSAPSRPIQFQHGNIVNELCQGMNIGIIVCLGRIGHSFIK